MMSPPVKKVFRMDEFCESWLKDPLFSSWLAKCKSRPQKAKCLICKKILRADKEELMYHIRTQLHRTMIVRAKSSSDSEVEEADPAPTKEFINQVKTAAIRFILHIVENDTDFSTYEHYGDMMRRAVPDSVIVSKITLCEAKITAVLKNVIDKTILEKTTSILRNNVFSILVDENSDIYGGKNLCIYARFLHEGKTQTYLIDYFQLKLAKQEDATGHLYKCFKYSMQKHELPMKNVIGVCVENVNASLTEENSIVCLLKEETQNEIAVFPCNGISIHLVVCRACEKLPKYLLQLLDLVLRYIPWYSKEHEVVKEIIKIVTAERRKMRHASSSRWIGVISSVEKLINHWDDLYKYFAAGASDGVNDFGDTSVGSMICERMDSLYIKAYVSFLEFVLRTLRPFNCIFKTNKVIIQCFMEECGQVLRLLASNFMRPPVASRDDIHVVDPFDVNNLVPLEDIYIGAYAVGIINQLKTSTDDETEKKINDFYKTCLEFYQEAFQQMINRLPVNETFLNSLVFLTPENALKVNRSRVELDPILDKFPTKVNRVKAINEWGSLPYHFSKDALEEMKELDVCQFWERIRSANDCSGRPKFTNIYKLAQICLSLPHSNAATDKISSLINKIKASEKYQIRTAKVAAITRIRSELNNTGKICADYPITDEMLELLCPAMYDRETIPGDLQNILLTEENSANDTQTKRIK